MSAIRHAGRVSVADYLEGEKRNDVRHEYVDGEIYAMTGASRQHNTVSMTLVTLLFSALTGPCRYYAEGIKVWVKEARSYYYPDGVVTCDPLDVDPYTITTPTVIFEVVSPTTEAIDRREKRTAYTALPSLQTYVILDPESLGASVYRRAHGFEPERLALADTLDLPEIGQSLPLAAIFARL